MAAYKLLGGGDVVSELPLRHHPAGQHRCGPPTLSAHISAEWESLDFNMHGCRYLMYGAARRGSAACSQVLKPVHGMEGEGVLAVADESPLRLYDFPLGGPVILEEQLQLDRHGWHALAKRVVPHTL